MSLNEIDTKSTSDSNEHYQLVNEKDLDSTLLSTSSAAELKIQMSQSGSSAITTPIQTTNLQKIAPKPPTVVKSTSLSSGKIVYIKSPNGSSQPIRIGGSIVQNTTTAPNSINTTNSTPIQIIKGADGNIYQIKPKQQTTNVKPTSTANNTRLIVKNSDGSRVILTTSKPQTIPTTSSVGKLSIPSTKLTTNTTQTTKLNSTINAGEQTTISTKPNQLQSQPTTSTTTIVNKNLKTLPQSAKIIIQPSSSTSGVSNTTNNNGQSIDANSNKTTNVVKIPHATQLRAVNVAGKGLQYVRVLNPGASNNGSRPVVLQRSTSSSTTPSTSSTTNQKPAQFITKKLEVTPLANQTTIQRFAIKNQQSPTNNQIAAKPATTTGVLLNNTQINVLNSSIDVKTVSLSNNKSYEIAIKNIGKSPNGDQKSSNIRNGRDDKRSTSPDPNQSGQYSTIKMDTDSADANRNRKHCNCTKSLCLKLYCDCFASGEFCQNCNCKECYNTLEKEEERQKAIKICLERNPHAFKPKIGKARDQNDALRRHTKGCNCKRSGCLKNYCECYEAKIACSANCKCIGCRNVEDSFDHNNDHDSSYDNHSILKRANDSKSDDLYGKSDSIPTKKPCNFITPDVIEATIQCIIAQADDCQRNEFDAKTSERKILEEFGRCLVEIIDFSKKNNENSDE